MKITAFPENLLINPEQYRELGLVKNFRNPKSGVTLSSDSITLVREAYERSKQWIYDQYGRYENIPANIETNSGTNMPFYLDIRQPIIGFDKITLGIQARKSDGHFFSNADLLTFEAMRLKGFLPDSMSVQVPYVIVPNNLEFQKFVGILTVLSLTYQLYQAAFELAKSFAAFLDAVGTGILTAGAQAAAALIFFGLTVVALVQAVSDLKELYFPELRYLKAYSIPTLIQQGCARLGFTLDSSLINDDLKDRYIIGKPEGLPNKSVFNFTQSEMVGDIFNKGYPTAIDSTPTLGSLIDSIIEVYNAKIFVYNGVVKIEKRRDFADAATVEVTATLTDQEKHNDEYTFNQDETWGRQYVHYLTDYTDANSPDKDLGVKAEYISEGINVLNDDLLNLTNLKEPVFPFAWAGRKEGYTGFEEVLIGIFQLFDNVVNAFGGNSNSVQGLTNRDGVVMVESQFFQTTKIVHLNVINGIGKQPSNYKELLSSDAIYLNYRTDLEVANNTFAVKEFRIPFKDGDFINLLQNNFVKYRESEQTQSFINVEVVRIEWFDEKSSANIIILLPDNSGFNVKTTKLA